MQKQYIVYILTNKNHDVFYTGITSNLSRRMEEHNQGYGDGFTKKYNVTKLVYIEPADNPEAAISYEKKLKKWHRAWKIKLVEERNPDWKELSSEVF